MPENELRYKIGRIGMAIGFAFVMGSFAVRSAHAADNHGHDARGAEGHREARDDDRGGRGHADYRGQPDNYYAPPPNYYAAPEPYYYDAPEPAPPGINLFFGL